ncbi:hypothetical protein U9M48_019841 [Paspalum notatum var. saurae]|uniref:Uncharacterized protein n=1 Tax=Paspalum notatum var. saurae TaxID=547442 RepID=A0AAQ3TGC3_PASNO
MTLHDLTLDGHVVLPQMWRQLVKVLTHEMGFGFQLLDLGVLFTQLNLLPVQAEFLLLKLPPLFHLLTLQCDHILL